MNTYLYTKEYIEKKIGHTIRDDTYIILNRVAAGEDYEDIITDLKNNLDKYNLPHPDGFGFTSYNTINKYLNIITNEVVAEEELPIETMARDNVLTKTGIYGIFYKEQLLYIGHTDTSFRTAFNAHRSKTKRGEYLLIDKLLAKYAATDRESLSFKPMIIYDDIKVGTTLTRRDKDMMVLGLITLY